MNRYNFILNSFGLQYIKPLFFQEGKSLETGIDDGFAKPNNDSVADMATKEGLTSIFGTPIFCDLKLRSADKSSEIQLFSVLVDVTGSKNIVKTEIQGRKGTVKEYINEGDHQVVIRGMLVSDNADEFPRKDLITLLKLCKLNESIEVVSELLGLFGIQNLVIENYKMPDRAGFQNVQLFELDCVENIDISFEVTQNINN